MNFFFLKTMIITLAGTASVAVIVGYFLYCKFGSSSKSSSKSKNSDKNVALVDSGIKYPFKLSNIFFNVFYLNILLFLLIKSIKKQYLTILDDSDSDYHQKIIV